ncbi:hypothetical protein BYT27DRAFT_7225346 [Phlegmacium glaucopus]|nr:hypothetical protein BYT27DRAFT_7225346 [Phlegmacium glaucopus]
MVLSASLIATCPVLCTPQRTWSAREATVAILTGNDVVFDVGTGCGKSLCFSLPLLCSQSDISLTAYDRSGNAAKISTVAVCKETLSQDIVEGNFHQVIVSPEIVTSSEFHRAVTSKVMFTDCLRVVNIDEAHCINIWGGSFRPDYSELGILRGRIPKNVPFLLASATLPEHVLDDIRLKLQLPKDVKMVRVTNAQPNVALSVRAMQKKEKLLGDLRFLIPPDANKPEDIPITLVYCNQCVVAEEGADYARDWAEEHGIPTETIAFYHALIGEKCKREIEEKLRWGEIHILFCTDAVGMVNTDLKKFRDVILWGLPPTFCSLVQCAGPILIVPPGVLKEGSTEEDIVASVESATLEPEALNRDLEQPDLMIVAESLDEEGIRLRGVDVSESEDEEPPGSLAKKQGKKRQKKDTHIREVRALSEFAQTKGCRRIPWDNFFENSKKLPLRYPENTMYQPTPGTRCCDNCQPSHFVVEVVKSVNPPGLKRGKKKETPGEDKGYIRNKLMQWRDNVLLDQYYGGLTSISAGTVMSNEVVEKIVGCGERPRNYAELRRHVVWALIHDSDTDGPNEWGEKFILALQDIYKVLDTHDEERAQEERREEADRLDAEAQAQYRANVQKEFTVLTPKSYSH